MADEVKQEAKKPSHSLREDVASKLAGSGKKVRGLVVENLTEREIKERVDAVLALIERIQKEERELKKLESQGGQTFNLQGNVTGEPTFTKQQLEEIKKLREGIERMQQALTKAFDTDDFQKVKEMGKGNSGGGGEQKSPQS